MAEAVDALDAAAEGEQEEKPAPRKRQPAKQQVEEETGDDLLEAEANAPQGTPERNPDDVPPWIRFPEDQKWQIPPHRQLYFLRFRAKWTDNKPAGDRTVILWSLSDNEEKLAAKRTRGESSRTVVEMAKGMIRAMGTVDPDFPDVSEWDGHTRPERPMVRADWTGTLGPGNVDRFWNDIGSKCRVLIQNIYMRSHALNAEDTADFFLNCLAVRSAVDG